MRKVEAMFAARRGWGAVPADEETGGPSGSIWQQCLLRALLMIAIGIAALLFPWSALFAFTIVFAAFAFGDGLLSLLAGAKRAWRSEGDWGLTMLRGFVGLILGTAFLALPVLATISYSFVTLGILGAWAAATGVAEIRTALRHRKQMRREWLFILSGALSVALGLAIPIILLLWPQSFISLAWAIAIYALFSGLTLLSRALMIRRAAYKLTPDGRASAPPAA